MGESQREESVWKKLGKRKVKGGKDNKKGARTYKVAGLIKKICEECVHSRTFKTSFLLQGVTDIIFFTWLVTLYLYCWLKIFAICIICLKSSYFEY